MKVLVTGANGFIGRQVVEALLDAGHRVLACGRRRNAFARTPALEFANADFASMTDVEAWRPLLDGVDAVVNCAGILRETRGNRFAQVHVEAPLALAQACRAAGAVRFIQISALGSTADGAFIASKHHFDEALLALDLPATVIRPSVVLSTRGSYGGTSLLRAMAALPGVVLLPGDGAQRMQPVLLEDLAAIVVRCIESASARGILLHAVGPDEVTLRELLAFTRAWLRLPEPSWVHVPPMLVGAAARLGEIFGKGPLGRTITGMLERGNVAPAGAHAQMLASTCMAARPVAEAFLHGTSFVQDRWHARLCLLRPLLIALLAAVWIVSGIAGLLATPAAYAPILERIGVSGALQSPLVLGTSVLDLVLGAALLVRWRPRLVLGLMLASTLAYTLSVGLLAPGLWLDPLGGLLKNLGLFGLLLVALALEDMR